MRPLSARDLLLVWEQAERRRPVERDLVLLAAACPELPEEDLAALPLGGRQSRLLALHQETFGASLELAAGCPVCGEPLEVELRIEDLTAGGAGDEAAPEAAEIVEAGLRLVVRPLNGADLMAATSCAGAGEARRLLARRALLEASRDGVAIGAGDLSDGELELLSRSLAEIDPQAEMLLDLACPACGHRWQALLDAAECLWSEVDAAARRLLREVHALARGYGWREADILSMSARRRRGYLEILTG
jgi:hypothetical protein